MASCPLLALRQGGIQLVRNFVELNGHTEQLPYISSSSERIRKSVHTRPLTRKKWRRIFIPYGKHERQFMDLFLPEEGSNTFCSLNNNHNGNASNLNIGSPEKPAKGGHISKTSRLAPVRGIIFFVHGGAWGSGHPWMYRLVALPFLEKGFAVAIVGYRTYPDVPVVIDDLEEICQDGKVCNSNDGGSQVGDIRQAWDVLGVMKDDFLVPRDDWIGNVIIGHSSGAHIALIMLVDMIAERLKNQSENSIKGMSQKSPRGIPFFPNFFIGLSGPYDVSNHFDFEAGRGVEQVSPMKAICGHSRRNFLLASPIKRMLKHLASLYDKKVASLHSLQEVIPPLLLIHGIEDTTVPFTATSDAAHTLRSCGFIHCDEIYLEKTGHQDVVMHFILGGISKDVTLDYLLTWDASSRPLFEEGNRQLTAISRL